MGKRRSERLEAERKAAEDRRKRRRILFSSESEEESNNNRRDERPPLRPAAAPRSGVPAPVAPAPAAEPEPVTSKDVAPPQPSSEPVAGPSSAADIDLDDDILQILGDAPEPEDTLGEPLHKDVAARWLDIVKKGLNKEAKEQLSKDYLVPSNCQLLVPPILNPEAKAALTEPFVKRDASMVYRQKQISNALSALAPAIEVIISKECNKTLKRKLLKPISDACRILCDMHHNETNIRRKFVISSVNAGLKDALANSSSDKYLFGDNMTEKLKAAKTVQRSGESLKITQRLQKSNFIRNQNNRNRPNFKSLPQKTAGRQDAGRRELAAPRQQGNNRNYSAPQRRAPRDQSPPPRRRNHRR
ncbi:hypothetical protein NE865_08740 [Phthorimaea operculella]|nr:hypothetical protein NE865_08740 [Phthorimaea operculella]